MFREGLLWTRRQRLRSVLAVCGCYGAGTLLVGPDTTVPFGSVTFGGRSWA